MMDESNWAILTQEFEECGEYFIWWLFLFLHFWILMINYNQVPRNKTVAGQVNEPPVVSSCQGESLHKEERGSINMGWAARQYQMLWLSLYEAFFI